MQSCYILPFYVFYLLRDYHFFDIYLKIFEFVNSFAWTWVDQKLPTPGDFLPQPGTNDLWLLMRRKTRYSFTLVTVGSEIRRKRATMTLLGLSIDSGEDPRSI